MNQHIYCELCFHKPENILCPLCLQFIDKASPKIHREKMTTLEIENILASAKDSKGTIETMNSLPSTIPNEVEDK